MRALAQARRHIACVRSSSPIVRRTTLIPSAHPRTSRSGCRRASGCHRTLLRTARPIDRRPPCSDLRSAAAQRGGSGRAAPAPRETPLHPTHSHTAHRRRPRRRALRRRTGYRPSPRRCNQTRCTLLVGSLGCPRPQHKLSQGAGDRRCRSDADNAALRRSSGAPLALGRTPHRRPGGTARPLLFRVSSPGSQRRANPRQRLRPGRSHATSAPPSCCTPASPGRRFHPECTSARHPVSAPGRR